MRLRRCLGHYFFHDYVLGQVRRVGDQYLRTVACDRCGKGYERDETRL